MGHFHSYVKFLAREREREGGREGERERGEIVIVYHTLVGLTVR